MGAFLSALKRAGKGIGRFEKKRYQQKLGIKPSAPSAGTVGIEPSDDASAKDRKKGRAKTRE